MFNKLFFTLNINSITRLNLDLNLKKYIKKYANGVILDVGSSLSPYKKIIKYEKYLSLDIDSKNNPDIVSDIHNIKWESDYFDTVIATEVLEHLENPKIALDEIYRILKKNGHVILTTRFFYPYHPQPKDYYRFTKDSLNFLFNKFEDIKIISHGNRLHILWQIINNNKNISCGRIQKIFNIFLNVLNPFFAIINFKDDFFPLGFIVIAKK